MPKILQFDPDEYVFEYGNEYAHNPALVIKNRMIKDYSEPKLYDANGDINKRWYVYYSYRNPATNKLERQNSIDFGINNYKTLRQRRAAAANLIKAISQALKNGLLNPYSDGPGKSWENKKTTVTEAFELVYKIKETQYVKSFADYKQRMNRFKKWLDDNGFKYRMIDSINKKVVIEYLNTVQFSSSARNRNNARIAILGFFQTLKEQERIDHNFVTEIPVLNSKPTKNKTYNSDQIEEILQYIKAEQPHLALYIAFISYLFMRPVEINRIRIKDINLRDNQIIFESKTSERTIKMIPSILLDELPDLSGQDPDKFLFGVDGLCQVWETAETNKRNHYSKLFKKVKDHFKLGEEYGLYSFRHTYITKLYRAIRKECTPFEAKSRLMLITGHKSMLALEKYLRDIDAELPEDYSNYFNQDSTTGK